MTNSILSCVWIKIYLTNQQWRSKILTLFCPQLFLLSHLCLCSITMTLNRPKNQYIFLFFTNYMTAECFLSATLCNICASSNAKPFEGEGRPLEWEGFASISTKIWGGGECPFAPLVPTALGLTTYILHSLRESTQLQVLSVSAHFLNGKRTVCLCRQIVREWHNGLLISFKSELIFYTRDRNVCPRWPVYEVKCLCSRGREWGREGGHSH